MKQDPIAKLYAGLTNKELAALAFNYMAQGNPDEMELVRIKSAVPTAYYEDVEEEFRQHVDGLTTMMHLWTSERWRVTACMMAAGMGWAVALAHGDIEQAQTKEQECTQWKARLIATDKVLLEICEKHGIDPDATRRMVSVAAYDPDSEVEPDKQFQEDLQKVLLRALNLPESSASS